MSAEGNYSWSLGRLEYNSGCTAACSLKQAYVFYKCIYVYTSMAGARNIYGMLRYVHLQMLVEVLCHLLLA